MHHLTVKKLANQYAEDYKEIGESALKLKLTDNGIDDVDADDIIDKIKEGDLGMPSDNVKPKKKAIPQGNANSEFEEWKVDPISKDGPNEDKNFDKVRKIKAVRIPEDMAARLNEQSIESKIRYYAI